MAAGVIRTEGNSLGDQTIKFKYAKLTLIFLKLILLSFEISYIIIYFVLNYEHQAVRPYCGISYSY